MDWHRRKKFSGGMGAESETVLFWMLQKISVEMALHSAGGYSFNAAVRQTPSAERPIAATLGISVRTL